MSDEPDICERTTDGWTRYAFHEQGKIVVLIGQPVHGDGWTHWAWSTRLVVETEQQARNLVMA